MQNIVIAFASAEDTARLKRILQRSGYETTAAVTSGSQAIASADELGSGVLICGYRLSDMVYSDLAEDLPPGFRMLLVTSAARVEADIMPSNTVFLPTPLKPGDLVNSLSMMLESVSSRRSRNRLKGRLRTPEEEAIISRAKGLLMERNNMTEPEAHRYIQKCAMDSGRGTVETAEMILSLQGL